MLVRKFFIGLGYDFQLTCNGQTQRHHERVEHYHGQHEAQPVQPLDHVKEIVPPTVVKYKKKKTTSINSISNNQKVLNN